jgi:hypothetical protein
VEINQAAEMPGLANPFGLMSQVLLTGDQATWPTDASSTALGTWLAVSNPSCP